MSYFRPNYFLKAGVVVRCGPMWSDVVISQTPHYSYSIKHSNTNHTREYFSFQFLVSNTMKHNFMAMS